MMARIALLLVIVLVSLSAYLRLAHSGLGCADWPACYGRIGELSVAVDDASQAEIYQRPVNPSHQALAWATPLHRLVASVLGLFIFGMTMTAFLVKGGAAKRHNRWVTLALMSLTVYLAMLGLKSGPLNSPAVVMGNLIGGFLMLGLLGWLVFAQAKPVADDRPTRIFSQLATALLAIQIVLGGLTSANFAATACQTLPDCHGSWLPGPGIVTAIDLSREHVINEQGMAEGGIERADIHKTHRLGAIAALMMVLMAAIAALTRAPALKTTGWILLGLVFLEFAIGLIAVLTRLPIGIAVAHNWLAGLLLLCLVYLMAGCRPETTETRN